MNKNTEENLRGTRHLRVGVVLRGRSVRLVSIWFVDKPVIQRVKLTKPIMALVELGNEPVLLEALDDPRIVRGVFKEGAGHSYLVEDTGVIHMSVPFSDATQLSDVRIRLVDTSKAKLESFNATDLIQIIEESHPSIQSLGEVSSDELTTHKDWPEVARQLGISSESGRLEIFVDQQGKYRWRLRRPDGEIVATSHQGFTDRSACEADLLWIRTNIMLVPMVPLDLS